MFPEMRSISFSVLMCLCRWLSVLPHRSIADSCQTSTAVGEWSLRLWMTGPERRGAWRWERDPIPPFNLQTNKTNVFGRIHKGIVSLRRSSRFLLLFKLTLPGFLAQYIEQITYCFKFFLWLIPSLNYKHNFIIADYMMFRNALIQTTDSHTSVIITQISVLCESYMKLLLII